MIITEVGCMGVRPGIDVMDSATPEGRILTGIWSTVTKKPGGPSRVYWGLERENPLNLWAFFDWDSVEQHKNFARELGKEAVKDFPEICTHGEFTKHVSMVPSSDVLQSPVTEVILAYFPEDLSQDNKFAASAQLQQVLTDKFDGIPGVNKLAHGWGLENDYPVRGKEGQLGSVLMGFIGWSSNEAQTSFHETDAYKDAVGSLQDLDGMVSFYSFSLSCLQMERELE
ncbi:uncharacterized protein DNG_06967 [Cephalotrichum gorgonifer]|uniref:ABM domain-containing protein n=1 Tax=Cephalotrichum gorgonifer TaxID=2041049 RepID=A0AAE8N2K0_9PEZI|nr:uncharacterized protein DNG_06967 [Cephalotrichum gorgonifer]